MNFRECETTHISSLPLPSASFKFITFEMESKAGRAISVVQQNSIVLEMYKCRRRWNVSRWEIVVFLLRKRRKNEWAKHKLANCNWKRSWPLLMQACDEPKREREEEWERRGGEKGKRLCLIEFLVCFVCQTRSTCIDTRAAILDLDRCSPHFSAAPSSRRSRRPRTVARPSPSHFVQLKYV